MTNPSTIDRQDVAHQTNPMAGKEHIEQTDVSLAEVEVGSKKEKKGRHGEAKPVAGETLRNLPYP